MKKRDRGIRFILILLLIASVAVSSGCLKDFEEQSNYGITDIEISADSVKSSYADLNVTAYIENRGGNRKGNTTLIFKVFSEQTGLLELTQETKVDTIGKDSIKAVSQSIRLPKEGSYRLVLTLYEEEQKKADSRITIRDLSGMPTDLQDVGIQINGMDFMVKNVTSGRVLIENDIYLKNEGTRTTNDYRVLVKAREIDARLVADKKWTSTGRIEPEATSIRAVSLTVPDGYNYVVEVSVWDGDTIVKTGEDYVQLNPQKVISKQQAVQTKTIQTSDFLIEESFEDTYPMDYGTPQEESPGFGSLMALISLLSALVMIRRGKHE
ncbi:MAG: hypothetical protein Q8J68_03260 [Methanolobus sp.]|uniref:DUF7490 domain-containing protein n=1 Tax=Methanolobus sp. TaxID=1874737 RepID=UPI0027318C5E|nr:PGF-CTERM sorting domain-containing protein [Methanolobus sp.]MDP2216290.1 hypothetical protein [Methanolobus sp.]